MRLVTFIPIREMRGYPRHQQATGNIIKYEESFQQLRSIRFPWLLIVTSKLCNVSAALNDVLSCGCLLSRILDVTLSRTVANFVPNCGGLIDFPSASYDFS